MDIWRWSQEEANANSPLHAGITRFVFVPVSVATCTSLQPLPAVSVTRLMKQTPPSQPLTTNSHIHPSNPKKPKSNIHPCNLTYPIINNQPKCLSIHPQLASHQQPTRISIHPTPIAHRGLQRPTIPSNRCTQPATNPQPTPGMGARTSRFPRRMKTCCATTPTKA